MKKALSVLLMVAGVGCLWQLYKYIRKRRNKKEETKETTNKSVIDTLDEGGLTR